MGAKASLTSKAVVYNSQQPHRLALQEFEIPDEVPEDGMLLRTEMAGICGSDVHTYQGWFKRGKVILGHEFIGTVYKVGPRFRDADGQPMQPGDRAGLESTIPCHYCPYCLGRGSRYDKIIDYGLCESYQLWGAIPLQDPPWLSGGWSEFVQVPRPALVHRLPQDLPAREAVLLEPLAVAVKAVHKANVDREDIVLVQGPGPIGLLAVVAAREMGAGQVYLAGTANSAQRLQVGRLLGVDGVIDINMGDPLEQLLALTGGKKASRVIDASGSAAGMVQGLAMTARGGVYVSLGGQHPEAEVPIRPDYLLRNKIDIRFSHLGTGCFSLSRDILASRRYPLDRLVTHEFDLERAEEAILTMAERRDGCVKAVLTFYDDLLHIQGGETWQQEPKFGQV